LSGHLLILLNIPTITLYIYLGSPSPEYRKKSERAWSIQICDTLNSYYSNKHTFELKYLLMQILAIHHDPDGKFLKLIQNVYTSLSKLKGTIVAVSSQTNGQTHKLLTGLGFVLTNGGSYADGRMNALQQGLKTDQNWFLMIDFDKLLHWLSTDKKEMVKVLSKKYSEDFITIGRSKNAI
jgi:hypothetical protein